MERENRKRASWEAELAAEEKDAKKRDVSAVTSEEEVSDTWRPPGVFDFPWEKGEGSGTFLHGSDCWDLLHVFFSSLVDGRSAAIGVPGARLSLPSTRPLAVLDDASPPSDAEADDVDCIWSTFLRDPLFVVCSNL